MTEWTDEDTERADLQWIEEHAELRRQEEEGSYDEDDIDEEQEARDTFESEGIAAIKRGY